MIKLLELFGGIGACTQAFKRLGIPFEVADYVEIDKYAVKSYNAINGTNFEPQDITKWDKDIDVDLIMHGSPCQDFSIAGKQAGGDEDSGTRSSLMYETIRIVESLHPKYVVWENVKNLLSKKHRHNFDTYLEELNQLGYNNYYQVLNAKDYGIPQNRERVYTISIRKDIDKGNFEFPKPEELKLRLKDMLEAEVDEKYYLSDKMINYIVANNTKWTGNNKQSIINKSIASTINTGEGSRRCDASNYISNKLQDDFDLKIIKEFGIYENKQAGSVFNIDGLSPTLTTKSSLNWNILINDKSGGSSHIPKVIGGIGEKKSNGGTQWYQQDRIYDNKVALSVTTCCLPYYITTNKRFDSFIEKKYNNFIEKNGYIPEMFNPYNESELKDIAPTQSTQCGSTTSSSAVLKLEEKLGNKRLDYIVKDNNRRANHQQDLLQSDEGICRTIPAGTHGSTPHLLKTITTNERELKIRKLTPKECWRLMGFSDEEFEKAEKVNSNAQLYKQAGNSIVVDVLEKILRNLFKE